MNRAQVFSVPALPLNRGTLRLLASFAEANMQLPVAAAGELKRGSMQVTGLATERLESPAEYIIKSKDETFGSSLAAKHGSV